MESGQRRDDERGGKGLAWSEAPPHPSFILEPGISKSGKWAFCEIGVLRKIHFVSGESQIIRLTRKFNLGGE